MGGADKIVDTGETETRVVNVPTDDHRLVRVEQIDATVRHVCLCGWKTELSYNWDSSARELLKHLEENRKA